MDPAHPAPLVTIAIPTYNRAGGYLRLALESALAQTYEPLEIVIADNCSTDHTAELVQSYGDPRVRYIRHGTPLKPNDNFNFCVDVARGRYLLLLHDDDLVDSDFVSTLLAATRARGEVGVIRSGTRVIDSKGVVVNESPNSVAGLSTADFFIAWFENRTGLYLCSTLYHTEKLREIGGFRSRHNLFQDGLATVTLAARYGRTEVREVKASFRVHGGELTGAAKLRSWCEDSLELLEHMCMLVPEGRRREVREHGLRFFAGVNYLRATRIAAPKERLRGFASVFEFFGYRHPPSARMLVQGTRVHSGLRRIKRRILGQPEWAAEI